MASTINATPTSSGLISSADNSGVLALQTGGTTAVTIDASQNVGIGTTSPTAYSNQTTLAVNGTTYGRLDVMSGGTVRGSFYGGSSGSTVASSGANPLGFETNGTERMRIDSIGNVGIGVSAPSANATRAIEVGYVGSGINGDASTNCNIMANLVNSSGGWKYAATGKSSLFQVGAGSGRIETYTVTASGTAGNAATFTTGPYVANGGTSWTSASDERLKNITGEISDALSKVGQLRAAEYTWKADTENKPQVGLIAQDVQKVLPEVISASTYIMGDTTEYLGVNYDQIIPLLVASIKELNAKVTALEAQLGAK